MARCSDLSESMWFLYSSGTVTLSVLQFLFLFCIDAKYKKL